MGVEKGVTPPTPLAALTVAVSEDYRKHDSERYPTGEE